ncbi:MAG: 4-hydroxyphenylacetate 3-hydroxylase [Betaproteobacteria bacterium]|nr:4-hydroxyphenylacetate 3-hydroxylase [Betaproteobacteria bacterium]
MAASSEGAALRTGEAYIRSIKADGRRVYLDGELVRDVTIHPAFREAVRSVARLYDLAADPANRERMTFPSPRTGSPVLRCFQIPRTPDDLAKKRAFYELWAEHTFGLMGRTPDHVAGFFTGYAAKPSVLARGGQRYADNVVRFHEYLRDNHQYISYAIVPPQIDRSKPAHRQSDPTLYAGVVKERDDGIVLCGAQQLGTGSVLSDWVQVSCITPLVPGDENHAFSVALRVNAPGVKLYPRRSFATQANSSFDYPLSGRFDETDSLVVLENAFAPWEQVFIYRNLEICRAQWWETPAHVYGNHQAQARYATKLRFMIGLAQRLNEMTGNAANPAVMVQMGELAALVQTVESMLRAQEVMASVDAEGVLWPSRATLYAVMALQSEMNPRMINTIRELAGGALIMQPSSERDFDNPETAADIERYVHSAGYSARERVALMRMAWDLIGTEFAGRHQQYEKFYGGAPFLVKQNMYRHYDMKRALDLVDAALNLPPFD